jgi:sugar transferase (PEP-CTERM/EpsH1 system associated)
MNILFIVPYVPSPIYVRPYNLIHHLSNRGHQVSLLTLTANLAERELSDRLEQDCDVQVFSLPRWRSLLNAALALPGRSPLQSAYCWSPAASDWLDRRLAQGIDDVIHVEHLRGVRYGLRAQETLHRLGKKIPVIWDSVDCISHLFRQASVHAQRLISRMITTIEVERTTRYEGLLSTKFPQILVTSKKDKKALIDLAPKGSQPNIAVLTNGCDLDYFSPDLSNQRESATLVVSGKMSYHANEAMTIYLVSEILPLVWKKRPYVKLWIVGKDPTSKILKLQENPNILITGSVEDIRPYLRQATISVSPVLYSAGIQNKVLEAMACSTPVIASSLATSALAISPGKEVMIANTPSEWEKSILQLIDSPEKQRKLGEEGRQYVEKNHRWSEIVSQLENVYASIISQQRNSL